MSALADALLKARLVSESDVQRVRQKPQKRSFGRVERPPEVYPELKPEPEPESDSGPIMDRIASATPINEVAARVVLARGEHWEPRKKLKEWSDLPLPTQPVPVSAPNLIGQRVNRLTVIGYGKPGTGGARWVVRCVCGSYGYQRTRYLRAESAQGNAMCPRCNYVEYLKAGRVP